MMILKKYLALVKVAPLLWLLFALAACAALPGSAPTNFYILKPAGDLKMSGGALAEGVSVGVGPVQIPGYADRPQIVTFDQGSAIEVHDFDHWAEPLPEAIRRVLTSNVSSLLGAARVFPYPADFRPDRQAVQVAVNIIDITQSSDGRAVLSLRWHVRALYDNVVLGRFVKSYEAPGTPGDLGSYAEGLSGLLGRLSEDIAASLADLDLS